MPLDSARVGQLLRAFDFETLFIEELGWDRCRASLPVEVEGAIYTLRAIAEKRGVVAYECPAPDGGRPPDYATRGRIEHQVARQVREHLIIFTDDRRATQVWQWVRREPGKPLARREHHYSTAQSGLPLCQKLQAIAFSLDEEEGLTLTDVTGGVRAAFDVERVTKRFYDEFTKERAAFEKFLRGLPDTDMQRWYVSVMLNRLMFVYFIQKKGFLNGDDQYLRRQLVASQAQAADRYYRDFLCPLFFEGFARPPAERDPGVAARLGYIPYLNGGIFQRHQLEELYGRTIEIPDAAFERLFAFFERYQWHLDERPMRNDNEINPDVLGYIFEKYVNQKQMGAYYTKEDITEYIAKNTIIPYLFDRAHKDCPTAFVPDGPLWRLLREDPDRYIYEAVRKGVELSLPPDIEAGVRDVAQRGGWNRRAPEAYALPTEIWREVVARRRRYEEVWLKLVGGEIHAINDLITYNLNIRQFAQDVVQNCDDPALLRAFYHAVERVTVLDPTVGSGAFLFAALNILEPLYEACLERMAVFLADPAPGTPTEGSPSSAPSHKFKDFRAILDRADQHPNRRYFILKSIVVNNLFGVDIMREAVEICQLRLFLKLVAQVDRVDGIEPLPDIDFNIRAGNSLVGYVTAEQVRRAFTTAASGQLKMLSSDDRDAMRRFEEKAADVDRLFTLFRRQQTDLGGPVTPDDKAELRRRLGELEEELNRRLAVEYGVDLRQPAAYPRWLASHQPFHWFVEFYGTLTRGGFDVIIGNPPYVEYGQVRSQYAVKGYTTESCGNLYAYVVECCLAIQRFNGRLGMIVQLPMVCTDRMIPLQNVCLSRSEVACFATFDDRPARLFDGLEHIRATVFVLQKGEKVRQRSFATQYNRWYSEFRPSLFDALSFVDVTAHLAQGAIPKIGAVVSGQINRRISTFSSVGSRTLRQSSYVSWYHNSPQYWVRATDFVPYFWNERDGEQTSTQVKALHLRDRLEAKALVAALNSSLFYWWFVLLSDCRHLNLREIESFPIGLDTMPCPIKQNLANLSDRLMADLRKHARRKQAYYRTTGRVEYDEFYPKHSKPIIDEIDRVLAQHYGFTDEELDFIINYDIKYRMGEGLEGGDDGGADA
jgi:hypothetical protein